MDKMRIVLLFLFLFCGTFAEKAETKYPNGKLKESFYICKDKNQKEIRQGQYFRYYENGRLAEEGFYKDGMKDSLWVEWGSNEKMLLQESWKNGLRNGKHAKWDSDGHLIEVGDFSNDKKDGAWKLNWIYINERQKGYFRNDYKNGGWIESGSMKRTYRYICSGEYLDGKKNGIWIEMCRPWDREFKSFQNQYYENGNLIKTEPNLELEKAYKKMLKNKGKTEDMQLKKLIEIYKWE